MQLPALPALFALPSFLAEHPYLVVAFVVTIALFVGNLLAMGYWARREAAARGTSALSVFVYLFTLFGALHYWYVRYARGEAADRREPPDTRERFVATYTAAVAVSILGSAILAPPDPVTQVASVPPLFAVAFLGSYLWVEWGRPAVSEPAN